MQVNEFSLRIIYNSRVQPTVEATINGHRAAAPSGASTGTHEALCFVPDNISEIEAEIRDAITGEDVTQDAFDQLLQDIDGTDNFAEIGAVSIAASFAFKKASGFTYGDTYPYPVGNLVGGGAHGGNTSIQEFLVIPTSADSIPEAMKLLAEMYAEFKDQHKRRITGINDEGAYVTQMDDEETLKAVTQVAEEYGARVGLDVAASEFFDAGTYHYSSIGREVTADQQVKFMQTLVDRFNLFYVEDPFHEEDYERLAQLTDRVNTLIVGDDVFVTQKQRLQQGIDIGAGNALIVKPNQVGTVTGARETLELAQENGYVPVVSHRSGETCDPVISDLAVEWGAPLIKAGIAGMRTAKNNQLLRLWDESPGNMADLSR